jgi:hypothetical protein
MMSRSATAKISGMLVSPFKDVSDFAWTRFVTTLEIDDDRGPNRGKPRRFDARTNAGGLGCYGIPVRRLVELHVLKEVFVSKGKAIANPRDPRVVIFLADPLLQRDVLVASMKRYNLALSSLPAGMTKSGALALCHRLGPQALAKWAKHQEPSTVALFRRANGLF